MAEEQPKGPIISPGDDLITASKKRFFIRKSVGKILQEAESQEQKLKRTLTALDVTAVGLGCIIGAGIFVLTGVAASVHAGPAVIVSFIIAGIACAFAALCYAEFASMIPIAGSAYTYSYATMGELIAWMIGWDLMLEYTMGAIAVSIGWSGYIVELLAAGGIHLPHALSNGPWAGGVINIPAIGIILFLTLILSLGSKESAMLNLAIVIVKVSVLIFIIFVGVSYFDWSNLSPFAPFGAVGILGGAGVIFFAYIGFDAVATTAEEVKNPARDLPIGILMSLFIATILYILAALVLVGMVPYWELYDQPAPFAYAFNLRDLRWASAIISVGAIAGITSVLLVSLLAQPRVMFVLARDGLIPKSFAQVHPRFGTPFRATWIVGIAVASCAAFLPITATAHLVNIGTLFAFVLVCCGIIVLRKTDPHVRRPFKVPLFPIIPALGAIFSLVLMLSLPAVTWFRFILWMGIGLLIYANYGYYKSKLLQEQNRS